MSNYQIGTTLGNMVDVTTLIASGDDMPIGDFQRWAVTMDTGDALMRALGRPIATWYWCYIGNVSRAALRAYCTGKSARVYIRTENDPNLHTSRVYQAAMIWPDNEGLYNQDEFRITFRDLVEQVTT